MRHRKLLLIIGALFLCAKAHALTLSQAETEVRRLVRDSPASGLYRYSDTILDSFLNQAQREVVNGTWCLEKSTTITLIAGTSYYNLPNDLIAVKLVSFIDSNNRRRELSETSYKAVRQNNPDYERQTGPPMQYAVRASTAGNNIQAIFLPIATTANLGTIVVDYYNQSTDLSSDSDIFLDGDYSLYPYHEAIVYQAVYKIKLIEGDVPGASIYIQLFNTAMQSMNSRLGEKPNLTPGFSGANSANSTGR